MWCNHLLHYCHTTTHHAPLLAKEAVVTFFPSYNQPTLDTTAPLLVAAKAEDRVPTRSLVDSNESILHDCCWALCSGCRYCCGRRCCCWVIVEASWIFNVTALPSSWSVALMASVEVLMGGAADELPRRDIHGTTAWSRSLHTDDDCIAAMVLSWVVWKVDLFFKEDQ